MEPPITIFPSDWIATEDAASDKPPTLTSTMPLVPKVESSDQESIFEMPTGGAAIMKEGPNLAYFARKEQCLALGKQLRTSFKINDYRIFRLFPSGEIQFLHPKDGVFPEKVNEGRVAIGKKDFSIGKNTKKY